MARKSRRKMPGEAEVPLAAMIDVTFLLLIYFIVTQKPVLEEIYLNVDLPGPGGQPKKQNINLFTVDVARFEKDPAVDLEIYGLFGRKWKFADLKKRLISTGQNDPEQTIIINCDPNARHQKLIRLLDACADAKLTKLNIINDESVVFSSDK